MLVATESALAAPSPKERADAKVAWTKGKRLSLQGKHDEARQLLASAVELDPKAQYQLDLARELIATQELIGAVALLETVESSKEPNTQKAKQVAAGLKKDVAARIPSIKIVVLGAAGAPTTVSVNGERVEAGKALPFDPGSYTVKGRNGDEPEVVERVTLAERDHKEVALDLSHRMEPAKAKDSSGGTMAPAAVAYAIGGAALVAGGVMGGLAFDQTGKVKELCGGLHCPPELASEVQLAQDYGTASTILLPIGGLGVAAGLILTFTVGMDSGEDEAKPKAGITPYVGFGDVGVHGRF